jgi:hypothetical protein
MANIYLSIFKHIYDGVTAEYTLISQLSSGSTVFDYKVPSDNTLVSSANNVSGRNLNDRATCTASFSWIKPDGSKGVCLNQWIRQLDGRDERTPPPGLESPTVERRLYDGPTIFGGKAYIAKIPASSAGEHVGGIHIQTISSVDYVVMYKLISNWSEIIVEKYKAVYDETLDQSTISNLAYDKQTTYENITKESQRSDYIDVVDSSVPTDGNLVWRIAEQNRTLVSNADGSKTVFFCDIKDSSGNYYNDFEIIEITDTDTEFSCTKHSEFIRQDQATNSLVTNELTEGAKVTTVDGLVDRTNCPDSFQTSSTSAKIFDGAETFTQQLARSESSMFLGCAYDKYSDAVIVLSYKTYEGQPLSPRNQDWNGNDSGGDYHYDSDAALQTTAALCINDVDIITASASEAKTADVTVTGSTSSGSTTFSQYLSSISDYQIIDLSSRIFLYTKNERQLGAAHSYSDIAYYIFDQRGSSYDNVYVHANGVDTQIKSDLDRDDWFGPTISTNPIDSNTKGLPNPGVTTVYTGDYPPPTLNCTSPETSYQYVKTDSYNSPTTNTDYSQ